MKRGPGEAHVGRALSDRVPPVRGRGAGDLLRGDLVGKNRPHVRGRDCGRAYRRATRRTATLLRVAWKDPDAVRIAKELRKRRVILFPFMRTPGVPYHNNRAENSIRQGVLFRKVSGGRRTWRGARVLERPLTSYRTCWKLSKFFRDRMLRILIGAGLVRRSRQSVHNRVLILRIEVNKGTGGLAHSRIGGWHPCGEAFGGHLGIEGSARTSRSSGGN